MIAPRMLLATVAAALVPATAAADVAFVKGGPSAASRGVVEGALGEARQAMAVCWRAPTTGPVRVKVAVGADGTVTAGAISKGRAAQCAAGILAVWSLPGGPWKGELDIGAGEAAAPALSTRLQQELAGALSSARGCQERAPGKAGQVMISLRINPDGTIDPAVTVKSPLGAALDGCVAKAVAAVKLAPLGTAKAVNYQLAIRFDGAPPPPRGTTTAPPRAGGPDATVEGSRASGEVAEVIHGSSAAFQKCGKGAAGKTAVVRFTIRPDGTTKNVVIKDASGAADADECVKRVAAALRFGSGADETRVVLPIQW